MKIHFVLINIYYIFLLGATAGFVSSSLFNKNWWQGFVIFGGLGAFSSLWLFGFPKEFPLTASKRKEEASSTKEVANRKLMSTDSSVQFSLVRAK